MSAKIQTQLGYSESTSRHSITTHLPTWALVDQFVDHDPELFKRIVQFYPRVMLHRDVRELSRIILEKFDVVEAQSCLLFPTRQIADECKAFLTSSGRDENVVSEDNVTIRTFNVQKMPLHAVFFPADKMQIAIPFWQNTGTGISTRQAEEFLNHANTLHELCGPSEASPGSVDLPVFAQIREHIASLLNRVPIKSSGVSPNDVYLFQTGMSAIYGLHTYLLSEHSATTVLFGCAFHSTPHVFEDFGPGSIWYGVGDSTELDKLEAYLTTEKAAGRRILALWTEFPSNPNLNVPDLSRLRTLADTYDFPLIVDDTIGSFCNIDLLAVADVVVTSLTKSYSGYADVMGASAVLSPLSRRYAALKSLFERNYRNDLQAADAEALERNSRDYMPRSKTFNDNAAALVAFLQRKADDPHSDVARVFYPTTLSTSLTEYQKYMRQPTPDFTPGYGCLFSVEFASVEATGAFYDALNVHKSPHLGAYLTLALPYVKGLYGKQLDWAEERGLKETQIRISVGLEDVGVLLEDFEIAVSAADRLENPKTLDGVKTLEVVGNVT